MSKREEILENWEELDDSQLSGRVEKMMRDIDLKKSRQMENSNALPAFTSNTIENMRTISSASEAEYKGASYTQQPMPMKILRRPTPVRDAQANAKPRQPIKTLKQRELEYAEARLRILGAAKNPEDDFSTLPTPFDQNQVIHKTDIQTGNSQYIPPSQRHLTSVPPGPQLHHDNVPQHTVSRMPRGPNTTGGFNIRR